MTVPILLAIDPGADCGLSVYRARQLVWAGCLTWPNTAPLVLAINAAVCPESTAPQKPGIVNRERYIFEIVAERPVVYKPGESLYVNPANIVTLAITLGRWVGFAEDYIRDCPKAPTRFYTPADWKRQVPKEVTHARLRRRLTVVELTALDASLKPIAAGKRHNALDAACIGLFGVGRCLPGVT